MFLEEGEKASSIYEMQLGGSSEKPDTIELTRIDSYLHSCCYCEHEGVAISRNCGTS
jgi:hypothetical protein